jgi:ATP/maltotriose-dependent transcriptional regulator MalT
MRAGDVEGREHLDRLLGSGAGSPAVRAVGQLCAASLAYYQGDFAAVHAYVEASRPVVRKLGDEVAVWSGLDLLALTTLAEGDPDGARSLAEQTLLMARRGRSPWIEAAAISHLALVLVAQGELTGAQRGLEEALERFRDLGNLRSVAHCTKALGGIALLQLELARARELIEQSLAIYRSLDDVWGTLGSASSLALVALEEHQNDRARRLLHESVEILRKSGHHYRAAKILDLFGRLAADEGRNRRAARLFGAASAIRESRGAELWEGEIRPDPAPYIGRLRSVLGQTDFDAAWSEGRALSLDKALDYAVTERADRDLPRPGGEVEPVGQL